MPRKRASEREDERELERTRRRGSSLTLEVAHLLLSCSCSRIVYSFLCTGSTSTARLRVLTYSLLLGFESAAGAAATTPPPFSIISRTWLHDSSRKVRNACTLLCDARFIDVMLNRMLRSLTE